MNIAHCEIETVFDVQKDVVNLLIVENPEKFTEYCFDLKMQFEGGEGNFALSRDGKTLSFQKTGIFFDNLFNLDFTDKKVSSLLVKKLEANFAGGDFLLQFNELTAKISEFMQNLTDTTDLPVSFTEPDLTTLLKMVGVAVSADSNSLAEQIICYLEIFIELKNVQIATFVNLKSFLNDEQLAYLYKFCAQKDVSLLLLESSKLRPLLSGEKAVVITDDLCELVENY